MVHIQNVHLLNVLLRHSNFQYQTGNKYIEDGQYCVSLSAGRKVKSNKLIFVLNKNN